MLRKFWDLLVKWGILTDIRSAIVGSIFGAVVGVLVGLFASALSGEPLEILILTNDQGIAQPMNVLVPQLRSDTDDDKISVAFDPPSLRHLYVCEYSRLSGDSGREILLSYLDKYAMCLSVSQKSSAEYIIRPNRNSGFLIEEQGNWLCKCR